MADSITLDNTDLLKGLIPANPHALVPVESLTDSPVSSTSSAYVLEWNSNSDSEVFQLSSPPSVPALTVEPTSPSFSPFSSSPSPSGSPAHEPPAVDSSLDMQWPALQYEEAVEVEAAPVSNVDTAPATIADDAPALNEHPEELNALIERLFLTDLRSVVNKWQCEASNADAADGTSNSSPTEEVGSPVTAEDASMTSTVLGYVHYTKEDVGRAESSAPPATSTTDSSVAVVSDDDGEGIPPSDGSSLRATGVSLISIAEYFRRKAEEGASDAPDQMGNTSQTPSTSAARAVSPSSALSYFSPATSTPGQHSTAPSPVDAARSPFQLYSLPAQTGMGVPVHSAPASEATSERQETSNGPPSAGRTLSKLLDNVRYRPPSSSESEPRARSPEYPSALDVRPIRHGDPAEGLSAPSVVTSNFQVGTNNLTKLGNHASGLPSQGTTLGSQRYGDYPLAPVWLPRPPELEFREALHNATVETPKLPSTYPAGPFFKSYGDNSSTSPPSVRSWCGQQSIVPPAPVTITNSVAPRKPRPPLPKPPSVKPQGAPTPQFAIRTELEKGFEALQQYFPQALPSTWTGPSNRRARLLSPSLAPPSPGMFGPRTPSPSNPSPVAVPPLDSYKPYKPLREHNRMPGYAPPTPPWRSRGAGLPVHSPPSPDGWLPLVPPSDDAMSSSDADGSVQPIPPPAHSATASPPLHSYPTFSPTPSPPPHMHQHQYPDPQPTSAYWPQPPFMCPPPMPGFMWGAATPLHQRRLRFATPSTTSARLSPPPVPPSLLGHSSVPTMPIPVPQVFSPEWGMPQGYMYSSPAPVIPPAVPLYTSANAAWYTTDWKYSFADATLVLRVELHLFRIHRHFLERHSEYFRKMLASYYYSENSHIFLPDVKKVDFEQLLSIFYPDDLTKPSITTLSGWSSVLTLAQRWDMAQVRTVAIKNIGEHPHASAIDKIILAHKHALHNPAPEWLLPALKTVCARTVPLALQEAEQLDMATVVKIWEVQSESRAMPVGYGSLREDAQIDRLVRLKFGPFDMPGPPQGGPPGLGLRGQRQGLGLRPMYMPPPSPPPMPVPQMCPYPPQGRVNNPWYPRMA